MALNKPEIVTVSMEEFLCKQDQTQQTRELANEFEKLMDEIFDIIPTGADLRRIFELFQPEMDEEIRNLPNSCLPLWIKHHISWFNYDVLHLLVRLIKGNHTRDLLDEYDIKVEQYFQQRTICVQMYTVSDIRLKQLIIERDVENTLLTCNTITHLVEPDRQSFHIPMEQEDNPTMLHSKEGQEKDPTMLYSKEGQENDPDPSYKVAIRPIKAEYVTTHTGTSNYEKYKVKQKSTDLVMITHDNNTKVETLALNIDRAWDMHVLDGENCNKTCRKIASILGKSGRISGCYREPWLYIMVSQ